MEPPPKRLRLSPFIDPEPRLVSADTTVNQSPRKYRAPYAYEEPLISMLPTRTIDLADLQRRYYVQPRSVQPKRNAAVYLLPRAPDVTVTANVVNIAVLDGSVTTSMTEIPAPTAETQLPISRVGTLTVGGISQVTSAVKSILSDVSTHLPGGSHSGSLSSASGNSTSTGERTVTVTATSTLQVSIKNGTASRSSLSRNKSVFTAAGFTTTLYDSTSTDTYTGFEFGDMRTSSLPTSLPTNAYNNAASSTAAISTSESSPTSTPGVVVLTPQQQQVVGGVVGGVAGVALVLLGILYFLKWYRQRLKAQGRLPEQSSRHRQLPSGDDHDFITAPAMSQSHDTSLVPMAALKYSLQSLRPSSSHTLGSTNTDRSMMPAPDLERSFQRVSGRKIPSVLLSGGDGYGDRGLVSPQPFDSSFPRSREVSQTSSYRDSNNPNNPFRSPSRADTASVYSTPSRSHVSPFIDPTEAQDFTTISLVGPRMSTRSSVSRAPLSIHTAGLSALNPKRHSDGNPTIRPSPARTPTTASPTSSSLRLPMHTPPLMSDEIPEMPPLHPSRFAMGPRKFSDDVLVVQRALGQRTMSAVSVRSATSVGGKFREEI